MATITFYVLVCVLCHEKSTFIIIVFYFYSSTFATVASPTAMHPPRMIAGFPVTVILLVTKLITHYWIRIQIQIVPKISSIIFVPIYDMRIYNVCLKTEE